MTVMRCDVVIAGASFAGLALALALRKAAPDALTVAVLEAGVDATQAPPDQRAFALSAASVHLLGAVGVWPRVVAAAQPVAAIDISAGRLESPLRQTLLSYDNHTSAGEPASHIIPAAVLRDALAAAAREAGVTVVHGAAVERIEARIEAGPAAVTVAAGGGRVFEAALAVAADGRRSPAREMMGIKTIGWDYPQAAIVTTVSHALDHRGIATQHFLEAGPFAILPLPGGHRSSLVWSERRAEAERIMALDDAGFLAELTQRFGGILGEVALAGPRVSHPLDVRHARGLTAERFALIGDAARGVHPLAGQGLNLGLRDVAALAECIVDARRLGLDIGAPEPLQRYERWRRFDSVASTAAMDGLNRLFSNDNGLLRTLRTAGLGLTDRLPGLKRLLVTEAAGLSGTPPKLLTGELP